MGSRGAIPFIENLSPEAIDRFQRQVEVIDRIGLVDEDEIERIVREHRSLSEPFPEPPMEVVKRRARRAMDEASSGDAVFGNGVYLDASAWLVAEAGEKPHEPTWEAPDGGGRATAPSGGEEAFYK